MRRLHPPVVMPLPGKVVVLLLCAGGICFATLRVVQAFASSSSNPYGTDAAVLTFVAVGLAFRLCIGIARPARTDGLFDVVQWSAGLIVVLLALTRVANGWGAADIAAIAVALPLIPLTVVARVLWG